MKKLIILMLGCAIGTTAIAKKINEKDVPATVKSTFAKAYPGAEEVKWEIEDGNYEANFEVSEQDRSVLINNKGEILETEVEMSVSDLPARVMSYMAEHYKGQVLKGADMITDAKGVVTYEAELKNKDLIFDKEGNFLK